MESRKYLVRLGAVGLDVLICTVGMMLAWFVLGATAGPKAATVGAMLVAVGYSAIELFGPQSVGKRFLNLKVGMLDGGEAGKGVLVRRWAMKNAPTILATLAIVTGLEVFDWVALPAAFVVTLGFLMALHPDCQALHDWANGTRVTGASRELVLTNAPAPLPVPQPRGEKQAA